MNLLLVAAGVIVAGIIAATVITSSDGAPHALPPLPKKKKTSGKSAIVNFNYVDVPLYIRKDGRLIPAVDKNNVPRKRKIVKETPSELAQAASRNLGRNIILDDFILATVIASEADKHYTPYMRGAIANTFINHQNAIGESLFDILKHPDGAFGDQLSGNYASTKNPPTEEDLLIAEAVRDGRIKDVTGGAVQFDSPRAQRALIAQGIYDPKKTPEWVAENRMREGKVPFYLPNVSPDEIRFWVPKKKAVA